MDNIKEVKNKCEVCGSSNKLSLWNKKITLCNKHYLQMYCQGKISLVTKKDPNEIIINKDYAEIILRNNEREETARALISLDKIKMVKKYKWYLSPHNYVVANNGEYIIQLHRYILNVEDDMLEVDHINRDRLNCQNYNLRICSKQNNNFNNSIYKNNNSGYHDIMWRKDLNKWRVRISVNKKRISLGCYDNFEDALKIRLEAEKKYFGEFAPNIIKEQDYFKITGFKNDDIINKCEICNSEYRVFKNKITGQLLCRRHSSQVYKFGKIIKL